MIRPTRRIGHHGRVSLWRIASITAAIALVPPFIWWLVLQVVTDADEGANIGGGIVGLGIIAVSWIAAVGFLGTAPTRRDEQG